MGLMRSWLGQFMFSMATVVMVKPSYNLYVNPVMLRSVYCSCHSYIVTECGQPGMVVSVTYLARHIIVRID